MVLDSSCCDAGKECPVLLWRCVTRGGMSAMADGCSTETWMSQLGVGDFARGKEADTRKGHFIYRGDAMAPFATSWCGARDGFGTPRVWERGLDKHLSYCNFIIFFKPMSTCKIGTDCLPFSVVFTTVSENFARISSLFSCNAGFGHVCFVRDLRWWEMNCTAQGLRESFWQPKTHQTSSSGLALGP